jgi:pilus assembly protein CpaB
MSRIAVVVAVVFAVVAIFMAALAGYYSRDSRDSRETASSVHIVVAALDIPPGTRISEDMLLVVDVPEHLVVAGAYRETRQVAGKVSKHVLQRGDAITESKVYKSAAEVPVALTGGGVQSGVRAMALSIDPTVDGHRVIPGERVDVFASYDGADTSTLVVENVEVLAVGELPREGVGGEEEGSVVTVGLKVEQAEILAQAQEKASRLVLALRSTGR